MVSHDFILMAFVADWEAVGHGLEDSWTSFGSRYGLWIFGALIAFVLIRGLLRAPRYRATEALEEGDRAALKERVESAEARTSGEIVVVVVEASDEHPEAAWKTAAATLLLGTLLLGGIDTGAGSLGFVGLQVLVAGLGYLLGRTLTDFRRSFVRESRATEVAEEQALQELQRLDLTSKAERTAVLLFVSIFEQRAVILADEKAHEAAGENAWIDSTAAILDALHTKGSPREVLRGALTAGIDSVGEVLATALPTTGAGSNKFEDSVDIRPR